MKLSSIKKIDNVFSKLAEEVHQHLFNVEENDLTEEDQNELTELNNLLINFNTRLLDLKIKNNSLGARFQKKFSEHMIQVNPELHNLMSTSSTEKTLAIEIKDSAFGCDLRLNEDYDYINENHYSIFEDEMDLWWRDNEEYCLSKDIDGFFQEDLTLMDVEEVTWGNTSGIRLSLTFNKKFISNNDWEQNVRNLTPMILRYVNYLRTKFE